MKDLLKKERECDLEKNKVMMIAIIILLVVLLVTIGVGFFITFRNLNKDPEAVNEQTTEVAAINQEDIKLFTVVEPIYTNLLTGADNEEHLVKLSISLGIDGTEKKESEKFMTLLTEQEVIVKDVIIGVVKNKTFEDLKKTDAREILKDELLTSLQKQFGSNLIIDIYIYDFLIQ